jgi:hypothetical protein
MRKISRILRTSVISGMPTRRTGSRVSSVAHRMGSTAFLLAEGVMRPVSGVPPCTMRLAMGSLGWVRQELSRLDRDCRGSLGRVAHVPAERVDGRQQFRRQPGAKGRHRFVHCCTEVTPMMVLATRQLR